MSLNKYGEYFQWLEDILNHEVIFCMITIFQGCFGGMGVLQTPQAFTNFLNGPIGACARFTFVACIAYTASNGEIELAVLVTIIFFLVLHLLRTEEERQKVDYWI